MSYATIMVHVDVSGDLDGRVRIAAQLAERFQSRLIGVSSWMPRPPFMVEDLVIDPGPTAEQLANMTAALQRRGEAFKVAVGIDGSRVEWRSSQGFPTEYVARESRAADLVIVSRERTTFDPYVFPDPGALLLQVGRPVLTVPPGVDTFSGRRVLIAWKDTTQARRAVLDALPFLHRADEVIVGEICDTSEEVAPSQRRLRDVVQYLASHRVAALAERVRPAEGAPLKSLLRLTREETADLIVAGAYGHSRLGEWMFGGMTQGLLAQSPVCCLFSH